MRSLATMAIHDLWRNGPIAIVRALRRIVRDDARPLMRAIRVPVLLIWGEHDPLVPLQYARRMLDEIPHARLAVIPRAGHVPMWESPAAFNGAVSAFLRAAAAVPPESNPPESCPGG
jgi:pimeloyl-ACP methyl ester carboxylesterase